MIILGKPRHVLHLSKSSVSLKLGRQGKFWGPSEHFNTGLQENCAIGICRVQVQRCQWHLVQSGQEIFWKIPTEFPAPSEFTKGQKAAVGLGDLNLQLGLCNCSWRRRVGRCYRVNTTFSISNKKEPFHFHKLFSTDPSRISKTRLVLHSSISPTAFPNQFVPTVLIK